MIFMIFKDPITLENVYISNMYGKTYFRKILSKIYREQKIRQNTFLQITFFEAIEWIKWIPKEAMPDDSWKFIIKYNYR